MAAAVPSIESAAAGATAAASQVFERFAQEASDRRQVGCREIGQDLRDYQSGQ